MKLTVLTPRGQVGLGYAKIQLVSIGTQGPPGPGAQTYEHIQSVASNQWIVNHNFGYKPVVEVLSPGGMVVLTDVTHTSVNQAVIDFNTPQTGTATVR